MKRFPSLSLLILTLLTATSATAQTGLYWTVGNAVQTSATNGSGVTTLASGFTPQMWGITYSGTGIFFAGENGDVWRMNPNGTGQSMVLSMNVSRGIVQANSQVYIANANGRIFTGTYNGTTLPVGPAIVAINGASFRGLTADATRLYWTDVNNHLIQSSDFNGGNITTLVTGLNTPQDIQVAGSYLYWADQGNNLIQRSDLNGGNVTTVIGSTFLSSPTGIYVTNDALYFTQLNLGVYRADLTGENITQLVTGGTNYRFLDGPLSAVPEPSTYAVLAGLAALGFATWKRRTEKAAAI